MTDIFTPKPFADITADMIEGVRGRTDKITDFNVGSVIRTLLEANAIELDDYYQAIYFGLLEAIPTSIYIGFGFDLLPAVAASGTISFTRIGASDALTIPAGTVLTSLAGNTYTTDAGLVLAINQTIGTVRASATVAGASGNADPNALSLTTTFSAAITATNLSSMAAGQDAETDDQRAQRFALFIKSIARGTISAIEYAATIPSIKNETTGVVIEKTQRVSTYEEPGHVMLYIHNGSTGATSGLVTAVQAMIDGYRDPQTLSWVGGYRPTGMRVEVVAMTETPLDVSIEVTKRASASQAAVTNLLLGAIGRYIRAAMPNQTVRPIDIVNAALAVDGVDKVTVTSPLSSFVVPKDAIYYLNDLSITWVA